MPKVSTLQIELPGQTFVFDLHYASGDKLFHLKTIPEGARPFLQDIARSGYTSEDSLKSNIRNQLRSFSKANERVRKVILLCLYATDSTIESISDLDVGDQLNRLAFSNGHGLSFHHSFAWEVTLGDTCSYYETGPSFSYRGNVTNSTGMTIVEWTAQRAEALSKLDEALNNLARRFALEFLDGDKAARLLDGNTSSLIGTGP